MYEVELADGEVLEYAANIIAKILYSQVGAEGHRYVIMNAIIDHREVSSATSKDDEFFKKNNRDLRKMTTKGWKMCVQWKDGSTKWELLAMLKKSIK
jgi:hypothetical protein